MRTLPMLVAGATFTTLLLVLPSLYWARWQGAPIATATLGLVALPFGALLLATLRPMPWLTHFGFFAAHLPAIVAEPGLTAPEVYAGSRMLLAVVVLSAIAAAWVWACRWARSPTAATSGSTADIEEAAGSPRCPPSGPSESSHPVETTGRWLGGAAALAGVATYGAFVAAALAPGREVAPMAASMTLLVGLIVAWYVGAIQIANRVGDVVLDVRARRRVLASLFVERRRSKADAWTTIIWLTVALLGALLWYLP